MQKVELPEGKHDKWVFTLWSIPVLPKSTLVDFIIYQSEYTKGGKIHYQGYIEFKKKYTAKYVKSLFKAKDLNLSPAKEDRESNMWYCTKNESYAGYRYMYHNQKVRYCCDKVESTSTVTSADILDDVFNLK